MAQVQPNVPQGPLIDFSVSSLPRQQVMTPQAIIHPITNNNSNNAITTVIKEVVKEVFTSLKQELAGQQNLPTVPTANAIGYL